MKIELNIMNQIPESEFKDIILALVDEVDSNPYIPKDDKPFCFFVALVFKTYEEHKEELYDLGNYMNISKEQIDSIFVINKNIFSN